MNNKWKYLVLALVFLYLFSGFTAVAYEENAFNDLFGYSQKSSSSEKKMFDYEGAENIEDYLDVTIDSLGQETIDFILAFGVVFAALWMGLSLVGSFGAGVGSEAVKNAQMLFAAFAAFGTAFYVNINKIPFTAFVAPYALLISIIILALIMGSLIIKAKEGDVTLGTMLVAAGMAFAVLGIGTNKFLKDVGFSGWGIFIALIGIIMFIIGGIFVIKDKYEPKDKKDKEAEKEEEESEEDERKEEEDEKKEDLLTYDLYRKIYVGEFNGALSDALLELTTAADLKNRAEDDKKKTIRMLGKIPKEEAEYIDGKSKLEYIEVKIKIINQELMPLIGTRYDKDENKSLIGVLYNLKEHTKAGVFGVNKPYIPFYSKKKSVMSQRLRALKWAGKLHQIIKSLENYDAKIDALSEKVSAASKKEIALDNAEKAIVLTIESQLRLLNQEFINLAKTPYASQSGDAYRKFKDITKVAVLTSAKQLKAMIDSGNQLEQMKHLNKVRMGLVLLRKELYRNFHRDVILSGAAAGYAREAKRIVDVIFAELAKLRAYINRSESL